MSGVAVLGGTFDPIHEGHLQLARELLASYGFSRLYLVPAYRNPLKNEAQASAEDRLAMVRLAVAELNDPRLVVLDWEAKAKGPSYTVVTLQRLAAEEKEPLTLILGNEVFARLPKWHEPKTLLEVANIIVIPRDPTVVFRPVDILAAVGVRYQSVSRTRATHSLGKRWIELKPFSPAPYSGTAIREALARGEKPEGLRHTVCLYIKEKRLYAVS